MPMPLGLGASVPGKFAALDAEKLEVMNNKAFKTSRSYQIAEGLFVKN
jgi:hypothetical protein